MIVGIKGQVIRDVKAVVSSLLTEEPALLIEGPRGSGKSTLIRQAGGEQTAHLLDLDDDTVLALVREDPAAALTFDGTVIVDEFQRAPEVLSVVKRMVDRRPEPGRFLLAGSVSGRLLPTGTETLTGRVHRLALPPLSAGEILGAGNRLLPTLLASGTVPPVVSTMTRQDYFALVAAGGFPGALLRTTPSSRSRWFASYLASVVDRDLPEFADIRHPGALSRLFRLIAQNTSATINRTRIAEQLAMSRNATSAYVDLLSHVYLTQELPGWTVGISAKTTNRPKLHVTDTGLAAASVSMDGSRLAASGLAGAFLESFVVSEIVKQDHLVDEPLYLSHFRDRSGVEVDLVIERADGQVVSIEVKSATTVNPADARGLRFLRDRLGSRFLCGLLLHTGPLTGRLDDRIWATPVSALWGGAPLPEPPRQLED